VKKLFFATLESPINKVTNTCEKIGLKNTEVLPKKAERE